jgi:transcriptional regulator with XRE-family HTH domain
MTATETHLSIRRKPILVSWAYASRMTRGERIKQAKDYWLRQKPDRTVLQLCAMVGVSEPTYYNWEGDKTKSILAENFLKFCQLTGFNPNWLLWGRGRKMLADDKAFSALFDTMQDFTDEEFDALLAHAKLLKHARKPTEK